MRLACLHLSALPLQLLLRRRPEWQKKPTAVVTHDRPHSPLLWVNEKARALGVLPGMKFSSALSFAQELCAGVVSAEEISAAQKELLGLLWQHSPEVEPFDDSPGVFWLNLAGLELLWSSMRSWGVTLLDTLSRETYEAHLVIGFSRFGTLAVACAGGVQQHEKTFPKESAQAARLRVFEDLEAENCCARQIRLDRLHLPPKKRESLARLGIHTLGDFLQLPPASVLRRYGSKLYELHRMASYDLEIPLQPSLPHTPYVQTIHLDESPESYVSGILFLCKRALHPLLDRLLKEGKAATCIVLRLALDIREEPVVEEKVQPAEPTLQMALLLNLLQLRLETRGLSEPVRSLEVEVEPVALSFSQPSLFEKRPRRDLQEGERALARVKAELGEAAVGYFQLRTAHMPEGRFKWKTMGRLQNTMAFSPQSTYDTQNHVDKLPSLSAPRSLVRRFFDRPIPLAKNPGSRPAPPDDGENPEPRESLDGLYFQGELFGETENSTLKECGGPYVVSGGWWLSAVRRDYRFLEASSGKILWVYFDRREGRWYLCGLVE